MQRFVHTLMDRTETSVDGLSAGDRYEGQALVRQSEAGIQEVWKLGCLRATSHQEDRDLTRAGAMVWLRPLVMTGQGERADGLLRTAVLSGVWSRGAELDRIIRWLTGARFYTWGGPSVPWLAAASRRGSGEARRRLAIIISK